MKKSLIASAVAVSALSSVNVQADIAVTNMLFGTTNYAAGGSLLDAGGGVMNSVDPFFYHTWVASQATTFMDTTGSFFGSNGQGSWDYAADIAGMNADQVAVGIIFNWSAQSGIAILGIFDCTDGVCSGNSAVMQNGPFGDSVFGFSGIGSATVVPVPAAVWLMGAGLFGLLGIAKRKKL